VPILATQVRDGVRLAVGAAAIAAFGAVAQSCERKIKRAEHDNGRMCSCSTRMAGWTSPSSHFVYNVNRPQMKLQRLVQELLRHFGRWPPTPGGGAAGQAAAGATQLTADEWQVLLFPDVSTHGHLKNTSWGPAYAADVTVSGLQVFQS